MRALKYILPLNTMLFYCATLFCQEQTNVVEVQIIDNYYTQNIEVGAEHLEQYLPLLKGKRIAVVANQTSLIKNTHLVDTLLALNIKVVKVMAPEHGFRGVADAGESVKDFKDSKTDIPIISLYGSHNKPTAKDLSDVDIILFDIQDVGVRFYTYISTLNLVMEAAAENNRKLILLDRPNPLGFYIDGPVLEDEFKSFVGLQHIPVVYGMTIGEYAQMLNGEGWLTNAEKCDLQVIPCHNYSHKDYYKLPVSPSPNLPNMASIYLYPSLCFFEGTVISVGRGTNKQFQVIGHPDLTDLEFSFTPEPNLGSKSPKYKGQKCYGYDLSEFGDFYMRNIKKLYVYWLIGMFEKYPDKNDFFKSNNYFNLLAGTNQLMKQIKTGISEEEIRLSWQKKISEFKVIRKKYLLYQDFE